MANNYVKFSEVLENLTQEERDWINAQLRTEVPEEYDPVLYDLIEGEEHFPSFEWSFDSERSGARSLWLYASEVGEPQHVALFVQAFLKKFRPNGFFGFSYAETCSKPRIGEFGGGAVAVTAEYIRYEHTQSWLWEQRKIFEAEH